MSTIDYLRPCVSNGHPHGQALIRRLWHEMRGARGRLVWENYLGDCYVRCDVLPGTIGRGSESSGVGAPRTYPIADVPVVLCEAAVGALPTAVGFAMQSSSNGGRARTVGSSGADSATQHCVETDVRRPSLGGPGSRRLTQALGACIGRALSFLVANIVRSASVPDVPVLVQLMEEFYRESHYSLDRQWAANSFLALLGDPFLGSVWLILRDDKPVGYIVLTVRFSMEHGGRDAFIDDLFVLAEHRRKGVATAALAELFAECHRRGVLAVHVKVGEDNSAAKAVYRGFGLRPRSDHRQLLTVNLARQDAGA